MDELQISGKRFISSRRIARDNGYTADYIGQLIRGGKVTGQKVGRAWYVDAISFDAYLGQEGGTSAKLPEEKVLGSASPQPDHFLQEVSHPPVATPAGQTFAQQDLPPPSEEKKEEAIAEVAVVYQVPLHIKADALVGSPTDERRGKENPAGGLRYFADNGAGLPEISNETRGFDAADTPARLAPLRRETFTSAQNKKSSRFKIFALAGAGLAVFIFCAVVSSVVSLNLSIEGGNSASAFYTIDFNTTGHF